MTQSSGTPKKRKPPPTAWKPGVSANPGGKSKLGMSIQQQCREITPKVLAMLKRAVDVPEDERPSKVAVDAGALLMAYGYGKPVQTMNVRKITTIADLSDEELAGVLASIDAELGIAAKPASDGEGETRH